MVDLSPINPVKTYISNMIVSPEQVAALEAYWGVNEPITAKIMNWLGNIIHGDLGNSLIFRIPVIDVIKETVIPINIMKPVYNFKASNDEAPWRVL